MYHGPSMTVIPIAYLYGYDHKSGAYCNSHEHSRRHPGGHEFSVADGGESDDHKPEGVGDWELLVLVVGSLQIVDAKHTGNKQRKIQSD